MYLYLNDKILCFLAQCGSSYSVLMGNSCWEK